ncbi:hypothetical protein [Caldimonas brevitalea]|uniref:Uncharacterized protein n=1 Tax=Caldimonas brevitalea TaxID=413882 RepID=A0A0G3BPE5_9BURK|nr:hypothetical protein [Caldimonas brevitalea]AKJ31289.1 hypothetical protein AAW51_4598 [Caldimonas brevitalea]
MKTAVFVRLGAACATACLCLTASAQSALSVRVEGPGLKAGYALGMRPAASLGVKGLQWNRWRDDVGARGLPALGLSEWSVLGDYYFRQDAGLRATGGVLKADKAQRAAPEERPAPAPAYGTGARSSPTLGFDSSSTAVPYLGMGYSGAAPSGGWGVFADVGVVMLKPKSTVKLGSAANGAWYSNEWTRREGEVDLPRALGEWRLSPLVQVGVSYSF